MKNFIAYQLALDAARALRPVLVAIAKHDADLERQLRRAMASTVLNLSEGNLRRGQDRLYHFRVSAGSAAEVKAGVDLALAWDYVTTADAQPAMHALDALGAVLWRLIQLRR
jgi:four helix bundle protein